MSVGCCYMHLTEHEPPESESTSGWRLSKAAELHGAPQADVGDLSSAGAGAAAGAGAGVTGGATGLEGSSKRVPSTSSGKSFLKVGSWLGLEKRVREGEHASLRVRVREASCRVQG